MYFYEDRIRAVKLYFKYGGKTATVVRKLGYPSGQELEAVGPLLPGTGG